MKSTLANMMLSLTALTALAGAALGVVNILTAEPIEKATKRARSEALEAVLPTFDNDIISASVECADGSVVYPAKLGAQDVGAAVETFSDNGFSGRINVLVGFGADGVITGYRVLAHSETPGLGAKAADWFDVEPHDIKGRSDALAVRQDGGDVDAITGATITSRAFIEAVNKAGVEYSNYKNTKR